MWCSWLIMKIKTKIVQAWFDCLHAQFHPPKDRPAPHSGGGLNSQVRECLVRLCHQRWRPLAEEPPKALREVERLTKNPEKLANAGGTCWKGTLGQKRSFRTHRTSYPISRGFVTAWQKTKSLWMDNVKEDLKEKTVLVEYVPTSFGYVCVSCGHAFLATTALWNVAGRPLSLIHSIHAREFVPL